MISPELLRRYPYLAGVSEEALKEVAMASQEVEIVEDKELFQEGDPADQLYILLDGRIDLTYQLGSGESRIVDSLEVGELVGWSALVEPYRFTATGKVHDHSRLIAIDARRLRNLCASNLDLGYRLVMSLAQVMANRLEGARIQLATVD